MKTTGYRAFRCASLLTLAACGGSDESAVADGAASDASELASDVAPEAPTAGVASVSERVARIEERFAATNARDWDTWQGLHTPDAVRTAPELEQPLEGAPALRAAIEVLSTAFPDYHLELRQAFGQGEWLAIRVHTTGTMTGPLTLSDGTTVPPTGQPIEQDWAALVRFQGDRIAEFHEFYDQLLLMVQLGLVTP
jgi:ketosteroid isomerase-like protein